MNNAVTHGKRMDKAEYRQMIDGKCVLVGDRWFPINGSKNVMRKYLLEFERREKRNARRRELRQEGKRQKAYDGSPEARTLKDATQFGRAGTTWNALGGAKLKAPIVRASAVAADSPVQKMVKDAQWQLLHRNSYDIMFGPGEVLAWVLVLDLVSLLDRAVRFLWREALKLGITTDDPEILAETAHLAQDPEALAETTDLTQSLEFLAEVAQNADESGISAEVAASTDGRPMRNQASTAPLDTERRLACERRKLLCRSTVAPCPTATDIRVAWHFRKDSYDDALILGGLMMDLECHLDNSLIRGMRNGLPVILGRNPGIRGWLREHCPELASKYFTLMRWKGIAKRLRQALECPDPLPTSALLDDAMDAAGLRSRPVHVQRRGGAAPLVRFPWERGAFRIDANGRLFLTNEGYLSALGWRLDAATLARRLSEARDTVRDILARALDAAHHAVSTHHPRLAAVHLCREIARRVEERQTWWRGRLATVMD